MVKGIEKIEIGVRDKKELGYGYYELHIKYLDEPAPYKAIVKRDTLIAIVSSSYKVVLNEDVEKLLLDAGLRIKRKDVGVRRAWWIVENGDGRSYLVVNSVDGSLAFKVYIVVDGVPLVAESYYRKHTAKFELDVGFLRDLIDAMSDVYEEYEEFLNRLRNVDSKVIGDAFELARKLGLPKKYDYSVAVRYGMYDGRRAYFEVAKKVWSSGADIVTKLRYLKLLHESFYSVVMSVE